MVSKYKFYYLPIKGLGELPRQIFVAANQEFEDIRIPYSEWHKFKHDPNITIFDQVPILIVEDGDNVLQIAQSNTINRFLARRFNLAGTNEIEITRAEMILDYYFEIHTLFFRPIRMAQLAKDKDLEEARIQDLKAQIPKYFANLQKILDRQKTSFLASDQPTVADLSLSVLIDKYGLFMDDNLEKFPRLKVINEKILAKYPAIQEYRSKRQPSPLTIE